MKLLLRIIGKGLMVVFFVLTFLTAGATLVSFQRGYGARVTLITPTTVGNTKTETNLYVGRGGLVFFRDYNYSPGDFSWFHTRSPDVRFFSTQARYPDNSWLGFGQTRFSNTGVLGTHSYRGITVPFWMVPLALILFFVGWYLMRRRPSKLWRIQGLCPSCGYDLRASPSRCPECGAAPAR
jgi:hypothetical protein